MMKYRSSKLNQKRKKELKIKISLILVVLLSLIFLLSQLTKINSLNIKQIDVVGEVQVSEVKLSEFVAEKISGNYFSLFSKRNILIYPKSKIEKSLLESFPRIKILDIDLKLPNNLVINIIERNPYVLLCKKEGILKEANSQQLITSSNGSELISTSTPATIQPAESKEECFFVDDRGFVFAKSPNFSKDILFKFYLKEDKNIKDYIFEVEKFKEIDSFIQLVDGLSLNPYKFVSLDDGVKYKIYFGENSFLMFDSNQVIREVMDNFQSVLNSDDFADEKDAWNIDYIDFRFGNKVFYKTR